MVLAREKKKECRSNEGKNDDSEVCVDAGRRVLDLWFGELGIERKCWVSR